MPYECKRCGYSCPRRSVIETHLARKTPCLPTKQDIPTDVLLKQLFPENNSLVCKSCKKSFVKPGMLLRHQQTCTSAKPEPSSDIPAPQPTAALVRYPSIEEFTVMKEELASLKLLYTSLQLDMVIMKSSLANGLANQYVSAQPQIQRPPHELRVEPQMHHEPPMRPHQQEHALKESLSTYDAPPPKNMLACPDTSYEDLPALIKTIKDTRSVDDVIDIFFDRCKSIYFDRYHPENHSVHFVNETIYVYESNIKAWKEISASDVAKLLFEQIANSVFEMIEDNPIELSWEAGEAWEHCEGLYDDPTTSLNRRCIHMLLHNIILPLQMDSKYNPFPAQPLKVSPL